MNYKKILIALFLGVSVILGFNNALANDDTNPETKFIMYNDTIGTEKPVTMYIDIPFPFGDGSMVFDHQVHIYSTDNPLPKGRAQKIGTCGYMDEQGQPVPLADIEARNNTLNSISLRYHPMNGSYTCGVNEVDSK